MITQSIIKKSLFLLFLFGSLSSQSQDTLISLKWISTTQKQNQIIGDKLDKKSKLALRHFKKLEYKLEKKLRRIDSAKASQYLQDLNTKYNQLEERLNSGVKTIDCYIPKLDSVKTTLEFLGVNPQFVATAKDIKQKLSNAIKASDQLRAQFQKAENVKSFLRNQRLIIQKLITGTNLGRQLKKANKQTYYYIAQVNEYKEILKDKKKIERKALAFLKETKIFQDFLKRNSELTSLLGMAGSASSNTSTTQSLDLTGLQTQAQVNTLLRDRLMQGGPNAQIQFRQNIQNAQAQLNQLQEKVLLSLPFGGKPEDMNMINFKPNTQKTKSFFKRLDLGTNFQTSRPTTGLLPITSDLGLSVGYKLNDKSIVGVGASYKMGWGKDIQHISITHQGAAFRSFIDWKLKGNLWINGGFETNYRSAFNSIEQLRKYNSWQRSGLIGLEKQLQIRGAFFKKTKLQFFWDFLSYQQLPKTQPLIFRVGYNL